MEKIKFYDKNFQLKILTLLINDKVFFEQVFDLLNEEYFNEEIVFIVKDLKYYFEKYKNIPSVEYFKFKIKKSDNENEKTELINFLKYIATNQKKIIAEFNFLKDEFYNFCVNSELKKAIIKSVDLLENGEYDEIRKTINKALNVVSTKNIGINYISEFEKRYALENRNTIPFPWKQFNDLTQGGMGSGELFVVIAPSGIGKSWLLVNIGAYLIMQGYKVLHYTLELSDNVIGLRYDSCISKIPVSELKNKKQEVFEKIKNIKGELYIKFFSTKTADINNIIANINKLRLLKNFYPDIIIIDYADLLKYSGKKMEKRFELETIFENLRALAIELKIPILTATQTNRSALSSSIIDADKVSESYNKIFVSDFVFSFSRKISDKINNTAKLFVVKNRFGKDGVLFIAKANMDYGEIEILNDDINDLELEYNNNNKELKKFLNDIYKNV